ncbi:MAG: ribosomal-protein-alanine N-acetyltransferase [Ruminococcaceae bacterium]|nr:ribosomal-protein-alanine N-acetyltransferase [Oscillospiraceae bacterium]
MNAVTISRFSEEHIDEVARIERDTFAEPWSSESLRLLCTEDYPSFVMCEGGKVLGYVSAARSLDELQIINVAVRPEHRGKGYAKALLEWVERFCAENGLVSISLEVRESNAAAIGLYGGCRYEVCGRRKGFYRLPREDALVMIKNLDR